MVSKPLEKEFKYYLQHQAEFVKKHRGKFVVIKNDKVLGVYETEVDAIERTMEHHELGTFLVQKCEPGAESYTHTYKSRVIFE